MGELGLRELGVEVREVGRVGDVGVRGVGSGWIGVERVGVGEGLESGRWGRESWSQEGWGRGVGSNYPPTSTPQLQPPDPNTPTPRS